MFRGKRLHAGEFGKFVPLVNDYFYYGRKWI